jgi:hypothetical protein
MNAVPMAPVALLYPGDRAMRDRADPTESRFAALFAALAAQGLPATPVVWHDDFADEVRAQLSAARVVLVWCNPIEGGRRRDRLDALLGEVAERGVTVSAHPHTIGRLGTKDVLFETRELSFGSDVHRIESVAQLVQELPARLRHGPRVLKQHRGHSGIGVWRVEQTAQPMLRVRHAERGSSEQDQVVGFGHQAIHALHPEHAQPGPRLYDGPELPHLQSLKQRLEGSWITLLRERVGVARERLPLLWDCDFMPGTPTPTPTPA